MKSYSLVYFFPSPLPTFRALTTTTTRDGSTQPPTLYMTTCSSPAEKFHPQLNRLLNDVRSPSLTVKFLLLLPLGRGLAFHTAFHATGPPQCRAADRGLRAGPGRPLVSLAEPGLTGVGTRARSPGRDRIRQGLAAGLRGLRGPLRDAQRRAAPSLTWIMAPYGRRRAALSCNAAAQQTRLRLLPRKNHTRRHAPHYGGGGCTQFGIRTGVVVSFQ